MEELRKAACRAGAHAMYGFSEAVRADYNDVSATFGVHDAICHAPADPRDACQGARPPRRRRVTAPRAIRSVRPALPVGKASACPSATRRARRARSAAASVSVSRRPRARSRRRPSAAPDIRKDGPAAQCAAADRQPRDWTCRAGAPSEPAPAAERAGRACVTAGAGRKMRPRRGRRPVRRRRMRRHRPIVLATLLLVGACVDIELRRIGPTRPSRPPDCAVELIPDGRPGV